MNQTLMTSQKNMASPLNKCEKCGQPLEKEISIFGVVRRMPIICKCKKEELKQKEEQEEKLRKQESLKKLFNNSLMDEKFVKETFENWDDSKGNNSLKLIAEKYCNKFSEAKKNGLGFMFFGNPGNGKTYTANCIANYLIKKEYPVICVSINGLLERIKKTYSTWGQEGEDTILKGLANADLLIIDDLGTEQSSNWAVSKVYNIIDSRYRKGLPLIITTNFSMEDLKEKYGYRTADRITEMCTPIHNKGKSIRQEKSKEKSLLMKEIIG